MSADKFTMDDHGNVFFHCKRGVFEVSEALAVFIAANWALIDQVRMLAMAKGEAQ
jgi:hypothetical protein